MLKKMTIVCVLTLTAFFCYGQSNYSKGEELFMQNKPAEAVIYLEKAVSEDPANVTSWLFLGIAYEQLDKADEAISVYRRILPSAGKLSANVANNLANVYFQKGNIEMAEQFYTQAIGFDSVYSAAWLGRANTRIRAGNMRNAVADYEQYLVLKPNSSQRSKIDILSSLIQAELAAEERRRIAAEEEERARAEERQRLLDAVSASLQSAADSSKSISSGTESVEGYEGEFELD